MISVEMIQAVVKEVLDVLKGMEPFHTHSSQKKKERLSMYVYNQMQRAGIYHKIQFDTSRY